MGDYEGFMKYADSSVASTQCAEERHGECPQGPDDEETGHPPGGPMFGGYYCECSCGHDGESPAGDAAGDKGALDRIQRMLRDPEWGVGMLEDIADIVRGTGREVENLPGDEPTWGQH